MSLTEIAGIEDTVVDIFEVGIAELVGPVEDRKIAEIEA
jgi:hypothetical protein